METSYRQTLHLLILLTAWMIPGTSLTAQQVWTLQRCIQYACENNIELRQQLLEEEICKNELTRSKTNLIPSLNLGLGHDMSWGRSVNLNNLEIIENQLSQNTVFSISIEMDLIRGLQNIFTMKDRRLAQLISREKTLKHTEDLIFQVVKNYLQILVSKEVLKVCNANLLSIHSQKDKTTAAVNAGKLPYASLLDIEAQLSREKMQKIDIQNKLKINQILLKQILGLKADAEFEIAEFHPQEQIKFLNPEDTDSLISSIKSRPEIRAASLQVERYRNELRSANGQYWPRLSFTAGYGTFFSSSGEGSFLSQLDGNRNPSIGFSLTIPIFNGYQVRTLVKNTRLRLTAAQLELQKAEQEVFRKIQTALTEAHTYYQKASAAETNLEAVRTSFLYAIKKFNVGEISSSDYIIARTQLQRAQSECIQSRYELIFQLKIIDFYTGSFITP